MKLQKWRTLSTDSITEQTFYPTSAREDTSVKPEIEPVKILKKT
jgi:hypothetical protein